MKSNLALGNFACFQCRKTFSRPYIKGQWKRTCPTCKGDELYLGPRWKSPTVNDETRWEIIEMFVKSRIGLELWDEKIQKIPFPTSARKAKDLLIRMQNWEKEREISGRLIGAKNSKQVKANEKRIAKTIISASKKSAA